MTTLDLSDLPSSKFDNELDKEEKTVEYSQYCNGISTDLPEPKKITTICMNLVKNITYLQNNHGTGDSFFDKHCYDLNYWLHKKVYSVLSNEEMENRINSVFKEFHKRWENFNQGKETNKNNKICMPESKIFETGLYKPMKELLDYFENFQNFVQEMNTPSKETNKYCEYILKSVPLYFTFQHLCSQMPNEYCTKYIKNSNQYDPSKILSNLLCVKEEKYKVELDENLIKEMINTYHSGSSMLFPGLNLPGLGFPGNIQSMFMNNIFELIQNGFDGTGIQTIFDKIPYFSNIFNYDIIQKYIMPSLYGLGGLIFFFVLYKCRRCLPCCCIFRRRKKKRKHLSDFDTSGLMSAPLGFPAPMMPINPYGLRYQPF